MITGCIDAATLAEWVVLVGAIASAAVGIINAIRGNTAAVVAHTAAVTAPTTDGKPNV